MHSSTTVTLTILVLASFSSGCRREPAHDPPIDAGEDSHDADSMFVDSYVFEDAETSTDAVADGDADADADADADSERESETGVEILLSAINTTDIRLHDDHVFVGTKSGLYALPTDGGEAVMLDSAEVRQLELNYSHLFYSRSNMYNIDRVALSTLELYYEVYPGIVALDGFTVDDEFVYMAIGGAGDDPKVKGIPLPSGGLGFELAKEHANALISRGEDLYFGYYGLWKVPRSGGTVEMVAMSENAIHKLRNFGESIVLSTTGGIKRYDLENRQLWDVTPEVSPLMLAPLITTRGERLYYLDSENRVYRFNDFEEPSEFIFEFEGPGWIKAIEVSGTHIYYGTGGLIDDDDGALYRRPLP